jgi:hypothetical protein
VNIKDQVKNCFEEIAKPFLEGADFNEEQRDKLELKYDHPLRVADLSIDFARKLNMSENDSNMFYTIALLHDLGRFEQIKRFDSFLDKDTMDHGDLSEEVVREIDFLKEFFSVDDFDIICKAIKNHNKFKIDNGIKDDRCLSFCKLIRDIDKLDIYKVYIEDIYEKGKYKSIEGEGVGNPRKISPEVLQSVIDKEEVCYSFIKTKADKLMLSLGYVFDINYKYSFEVLKKAGYYDRLINIVEKEVDDFDNLKPIYIDFINENLES